jgi:hypothetical protein
MGKALAAILALSCALPTGARAADITGLPGLEAPPAIEPAPKAPKKKTRKKRPRRVHKSPKKPPETKPASSELAAPASTASPGKYSGRFFAFETLEHWKGPLAVEAGVRYEPPEGDASFSVRFVPKKHRLYRDPEAYRRWLRSRGSISDSLTLDTVRVGMRYGSRARFSTHQYGGRYLFGKSRRERYNEIIVVPVSLGAYLIHYEADYRDFDRFRDGYLIMLKTLKLPPDAKYKAEEFYRKRSHLLRPLIEDRVRKDVSRHGGMNNWYGNPYRAVAQVGVPLGAKHGGNSLGGGRVIILGGLLGVNETLSLGGSLTSTSYSGASSIGIDLLVRTMLMKQKPVTPYISFMGGIEQFKIGGAASLGTAFSFGAGAAMRAFPQLDATLELRYRSSSLDGKEVSGSVKSPQLLLGLAYYFGKI